MKINEIFNPEDSIDVNTEAKKHAFNIISKQGTDKVIILQKNKDDSILRYKINPTTHSWSFHELKDDEEISFDYGEDYEGFAKHIKRHGD